MDSPPDIIADDAPDWASIDRDILCPLCEYNLRGLIDPRCPECGHAFDWTDLLDRDRWEHPWLFEHRRKHRIRGFFRTFFESLLPWRFWRSVRPTHTPMPLRLFCYWMVFVAIAGIAIAAPIARPIIADYLFGPAWWLGNVPRAMAYESRVQLAIILPIAMMYIFWPGMTLLVLMLFRQTMRQARIKPDHVVRCTVYSCDAMILGAIPVGILAMTDDWLDRTSSWYYVGPLLHPLVAMFLLLALLVLTCRLATAYRMYLGFPHAIATCVLSQVVVALAMLAAYLMWITRN